MGADHIAFWVFLVLNLAVSFYAGRGLLRMMREKPGFAYFVGTLLLTILAFPALASSPFGFFLFLALLVVFSLLVAKRVLMTGRVIRGRLACIAWFSGGVVLHLAFWNDELYKLPVPHLVSGISVLLVTGFFMLMTGFLFASLQLRDAETYFT